MLPDRFKVFLGVKMERLFLSEVSLSSRLRLVEGKRVVLEQEIIHIHSHPCVPKSVCGVWWWWWEAKVKLHAAW